jgi:predicted amidohydrolase YtcJ
MVVKDDLIEYVGHECDADVLRAKENRASVVDTQNRAVVLGFIDRHMHFLLFGSALRKDNLESCKNWTISGLQSRPMLRPTLLYRGSSVVGWTHPVALASMLDDLDDRPIFIGSTYHRMPPNTVVCRPPAWWLGGLKNRCGESL